VHQKLAMASSLASLMVVSWAGLILWTIQFHYTVSLFQQADGWFSVVVISIGLLGRTLITVVGTCVIGNYISRFFRQQAD
jgi:hypothetical protein